MPTVATRNIYVDEEGVAWIEGTGIKVKEVVIDKVFWGMSPEEMLAEHSHWSLPQIYAALSYYYDHQAEVDEQIERDRQEVEAMRAEQEKTMGESPVRKRLRELGKLPCVGRPVHPRFRTSDRNWTARGFC